MTIEQLSVTPSAQLVAAADTQPSVGQLTSPETRTGAPIDTLIAVTVRLPNGGGVDETTVNPSTVKLFRGAADGTPVAGQPNTTGGGDAITFQPADLLEPNTSYTFVVTEGVRDTRGNAFIPFSTTFTTGSAVVPTDPSIAFEKIYLPTAQGERYSALTFGPDGFLYAGTLTGLIHRFAVNADGTLSAPQVITTVQSNNGGRRFLTGLRFDPASSGASPILWVTHAQYVADNGTLNWNAPDWTGKVSRLSGPGLSVYEDYVVNLPRSVRDHLTNQMDFGPDGGLYFGQAANNSMGAPDPIWGMRPEHLLNSAVLRLDTGAVAARIAAGQGPLDAKTEEGGTYDPWAPGAPLTLYATGLRNVYDLVWHRNGQLYAPTNGSAAGGFTPGFAGGTAPRRIDQSTAGPYTGPTVQALSDVQQTENDYLNKVVAGGYYGHPNPTRGEYVLDGGNPTAGQDPDEFTAYQVGVQPDRNYRRSIYNFGRNYAPTGTIEYKGAAFNGALDGRLLIARYSGGDDIVVAQLDGAGNVAGVQSGLAGLTHFVDPLDIAQNPSSGFVYVSEDGARRITLVRPLAAGANLALSSGQVVFNDPVGPTAGPNRTLTITNTGTSPLALPSDGLRITGADAALFRMVSRPVLPDVIAPGESIQLTMSFSAPAGALTIRGATLEIKSNDPDQPLVQVALRGLPTAGTGGVNEPSLQRILDLYQIPTNVGDADPNNVDLYSNAQPRVTPNDEVPAQRLVKAGAGAVTVEPLAVFGVSATPAARFGWYDAGSPQSRNELFRVANSESQSVATQVDGVTTFDPGAKGFSFYSIWPGFSNREIYGEDPLNATETGDPHKIRFFKLRNPDGSVVPDALILASEDFFNAPNNNYDFQDVVAILRNVRAAPDGPEIGTENVDGSTTYDRLEFSRIQNNPGNGVHDVATLRVRNTGTAPLNLTGASITAGPYQLASAPAFPASIPVGGTQDIQVRFVATSGRVTPGTLRLTSNDPDEPALDIALAGYWQVQPENQQEPTLPEVLSVFDIRTVLQNPGQLLSNGGRLEAVGDEVLSPYWVRADNTLPVTVRQLAAFHTSNEGHAVRWYRKGNTGTLNTALVHSTLDAQSLLPRNSTNTGPAVGTFTPSGTTPFGFKIQGEWADPTLNPRPAGRPDDQGHHVRFFPLRDRTGAIVRDSWLMIMDFSGVNYDYNDNVYVVSNMRPENPATPAGLSAATRREGGFQLAWQPNTEQRVVGYNVYRSLNATSGFARLNTAPVTSPSYVDDSASRGGTYFYRVTAADAYGGESAQTAAVRTDVTPPAPVQSLGATPTDTAIVLTWSANAETDLVGYRVYRSDQADGVYTPLNNGQIVSGNTFADSVSPGGFTWHYRVTAVDASGNESEPSTVSASRPGGLGAVLTAEDVTAAGATSYGFAVTFSDNASISVQSLANALTVIGPAGFSQAAQVVALNGRTATFVVTPPGGAWDPADNGEYTVSVQPNAVGDGAGHFLAAGPLGTFTAAVQAPPFIPIDLGTFGPKGKKIAADQLTPGSQPDLYYSFTLTQPSKLKARLGKKLKDNLDFELLDTSGNVLASSAKPGRKGEAFARALPAGTYILHVKLSGTTGSPFKMNVQIKRPSKKELLALGGT